MHRDAVKIIIFVSTFAIHTPAEIRYCFSLRIIAHLFHTERMCYCSEAEENLQPVSLSDGRRRAADGPGVRYRAQVRLLQLGGGAEAHEARGSVDRGGEEGL